MAGLQALVPTLRAGVRRSLLSEAAAATATTDESPAPSLVSLLLDDQGRTVRCTCESDLWRELARSGTLAEIQRRAAALCEETAHLSLRAGERFLEGWLAREPVARGVVVSLRCVPRGTLAHAEHAARSLHLGTRETQVALLYAQGHTYREIAALTGTTLSTVKSHLEHIRRKAKVSSRNDLQRLLLGAPPR